MKLLFKVFLLSRPQERGFVLPVIIALGLIMTLVGTISIFQSSDEQLTASSQRATAKALAAAEIGVARYRELIDKNKIIALYDACKNWNSDKTCNTTGSEFTWAKKNIPNVSTSCLTDPNDATIKAADYTANQTTRAWQNITSGSPANGQYRLIDYTYTPGVISGNTYKTQPIGTLIVEGRANQRNTEDSESQAAVARVEVDLPIQPGIPTPNGEQILLAENFNHLHPALWITGDAEGVTNSDDLTVDGNIVVTDTDDCEQSNSQNDKKITTSNLNDTNKQSIILTPIDLRFSPYDYKTAPGSNVNTLTNDDIKNGITLPRPGQNDLFEHIDSNSNGEVDIGEDVYYHYRVDENINITNKDIKIVAERKVILYIDGNISLTASGASSSVNVNDSNPSYFLEIYGTDKTKEITLNSDGTNNGAINIKAFIHAPNATVEFAGKPTVKITGAVWVNDWDGTNLNTNVVIEPDSQDPNDISKQYYNYTYIRKDLVTSGARVVDPVISVPSRWETQQAE